MDEHEIFDDVEGAPATADALRAIVARHQRARTRTLAVALAVALIAGPLAGWAIARNGEGGGQQVTATPAAAPNGDGNRPVAQSGSGMAFGQSAFAFGGPGAPTAQHLFTR